MVKPFQFTRIPRIIFRNGEISRLPDHIRAFGKSVILVTGRSSFVQSAAWEKLLAELGERKTGWYHATVAGEPSPEDIDDVVRESAGKGFDVVAGIGGGSVLDAGKAISAMTGIGNSVERFLESVGDLEHPGSKIPFIAVPTTSGTGSEATKNAVISRTGRGGFKKSLRHDNFVPDLAVIDPELTLSCPADITAASGMDCFTQLTEAYLSDKASDYTDALALEGLKAIRDYLVRCVRNGEDIEARAGMSFAALTSGICLANAGLGVVHGFASSVGGFLKIPHGVVCASLMAKANEITVRELRKNKGDGTALAKYACLGQLFAHASGLNEAGYADAFLNFTRELSQELSLPGFSKFDMEEKDIIPICRVTENKNNPVRLNESCMAEILASRLF